MTVTLFKKKKFYPCFQMQELENENDKLKREVQRLMKAIAKTTDFGDNGGQVSPAAKEFMGEHPMKTVEASC